MTAALAETETTVITEIMETIQTTEITRKTEIGDFIPTAITQVQLQVTDIGRNEMNGVEKGKEKIREEGEKEGNDDLSETHGIVGNPSSLKLTEISIENQILQAIEELSRTEFQGERVLDLNLIMKSTLLSLSSLPPAKISIFTGVNDQVKNLKSYHRLCIILIYFFSLFDHVKRCFSISLFIIIIFVYVFLIKFLDTYAHFL